MRRRAVAFLALALAGASCVSEPDRRGWESLRAAVQGAESPVTAVYFWAPWSRASVELRPSIAELGREYEGLGVGLLEVCLSDAPDDCRDAAGGWVAPVDFERLLADYGAAEPPALAVFSGGGPAVLSGDALTPEAAFDAIEASLSP